MNSAGAHSNNTLAATATDRSSHGCHRRLPYIRLAVSSAEWTSEVTPPQPGIVDSGATPELAATAFGWEPTHCQVCISWEDRYWVATKAGNPGNHLWDRTEDDDVCSAFG